MKRCRRSTYSLQLHISGSYRGLLSECAPCSILVTAAPKSTPSPPSSKTSRKLISSSALPQPPHLLANPRRATSPRRFLNAELRSDAVHLRQHTHTQTPNSAVVVERCGMLKLSHLRWQMLKDDYGNCISNTAERINTSPLHRGIIQHAMHIMSYSRWQGKRRDLTEPLTEQREGEKAPTPHACHRSSCITRPR